MKKYWPLLLIFGLALGLRVYRLGQPVLKEDEFTTVKAATYVYQCQKDAENCRSQPIDFKNKLLALVTANETTPNLGVEIYLWDFIKDQASEIHHSRAWPHLYSVAVVYQFLGINEFSSRLVSVLAGSLLVIVGYLFSRVMGTSVNLSLIYSFLLTISFPLIDFSRNARMYSVYILAFLLLVSAIYRSKWWLVVILFLLAYWLQMLTLILPLAILVWAIIERRRVIVFFLFLGLLSVFWLTRYFGVDFFGQQFLAINWPLHWKYLNWWWLGAIIGLAAKRSWHILSIIAVYFFVLIFFTNLAPSAAYIIMLWPLALWAWLNWNKLWSFFIIIFIIIQFFAGINYLYFGRDGRAQISTAYSAIKNNFQPGDKIYAVQLRDYYLQDLPKDTLVIDLQKEPNPDFSGSGFVVWEEEKTSHLSSKTRDYIKSNFKFLGSGGVEIYSFGK